MLEYKMPILAPPPTKQPISAGLFHELHMKAGYGLTETFLTGLQF